MSQAMDVGALLGACPFPDFREGNLSLFSRDADTPADFHLWTAYLKHQAVQDDNGFWCSI
jgi:hypothetical protein